MPKRTLVLASFAVPASLVDNAVCGGYVGEFEAYVFIAVDPLNEDGFVTDNHKFIEFVRDFFEDGTYKASCEELAEALAALVLLRVTPITRLISVKTRVRNQTGYAQFEWVYGDIEPQLPRKATQQEIDDSDGPSFGC